METNDNSTLGEIAGGMKPAGLSDREMLAKVMQFLQFPQQGGEWVPVNIKAMTSLLEQVVEHLCGIQS